jgi:outer membrane protein
VATGRRIAAVIGLTLWVSGPAAAQMVQVPSADVLAPEALEAPRLAMPMIGLGQAVELTIRQSPGIRRAAERLVAADGRYRQARGLFDTTLRSNPNLTVTLEPMTPFLRRLESGKRATIQGVVKDFTELTTILRQIIQATPHTTPRCPADLSFDLSATTLVRRDPSEVTLLGLRRDLGSTVLIDLGDLPQRASLTSSGVISGLELGDICTKPIEPFFSPDAFGDVLRQIDQSAGLGLSGVLTSTAQIPREFRMLQEQITETVAFRANLALDKLGPVPVDDLRKNLAVDLSASKLFRNGLFADVMYQVQSQEDNYVDKPLDPAFGGLGLPQEFFSSVSADLTIPLLRGRGRVSATAPERAAERIVAAEREQFRHVVLENVFRTVLAYLNLAAAQDTARLLDESSARNQQILGATQQRANAGDLAVMEVGRVQARAAIVASSAAQARAAVQEARLSLAEAMGVAVVSLDEAPVPRETLATTLAEVGDAKAALEHARAERHDVRAARVRQDAAEVLATGARADERRKVDLMLTGGFSNLYDSPFYRYLTDGANAILQTNPVPVALLTGAPAEPPQSPVRYYDPRGFYRSVTGRYEPFGSVTVIWQLPFGNNSAKGRAAQAEAALRSAGIESRDLSRVIDQNVLASIEAVRRASSAATAGQAAVENNAQVLASVLQLLQAGGRTIIDTLLTEESATNDQLQLVRRHQVYLSALARLKFDTASLVTFENAGRPDEQIRFLPTDFVGR